MFNYQILNNLAAVDDNEQKIIDAGVLQDYAELLRAQCPESVQTEVARGLFTLSVKWKDKIEETGCLQGPYVHLFNIH